MTIKVELYCKKTAQIQHNEYALTGGAEKKAFFSSSLFFCFLFPQVKKNKKYTGICLFAVSKCSIYC